MHLNLANSKVPRCQHIKADGVQCNNPSLKTARFCYYHAQIRRSTRTPHTPVDIALDSIPAITIALTNVAHRINRGAIDPVEARLMLRAIHNATIVLKLKNTLPEEKPAQVVTDPGKLEPHVVVLTPEEYRKVKAGRAFFDTAAMIAREIRADERAKEAAQLHFDSPSIGPSPYTMLPSEYDDDEPSSTSELDRLPPEQREREIERRHSEIDKAIPAASKEEPAHCVFFDEPDKPSCHYVDVDPRIFTCPVNKARDAASFYLVPELTPFLKDPRRCELLNFIAIGQQESGYSLAAGPRDGLSRPFEHQPPSGRCYVGVHPPVTPPVEPEPWWKQPLRRADHTSAIAGSDVSDSDVSESSDQ